MHGAVVREKVEMRIENSSARGEGEDISNG